MRRPDSEDQRRWRWLMWFGLLMLSGCTSIGGCNADLRHPTVRLPRIAVPSLSLPAISTPLVTVPGITTPAVTTAPPTTRPAPTIQPADRITTPTSSASAPRPTAQAAPPPSPAHPSTTRSGPPTTAARVPTGSAGAASGHPGTGAQSAARALRWRPPTFGHPFSGFMTGFQSAVTALVVGLATAMTAMVVTLAGAAVTTGLTVTLVPLLVVEALCAAVLSGFYGLAGMVLAMVLGSLTLLLREMTFLAALLLLTALAGPLGWVALAPAAVAAGVGARRWSRRRRPPS